MLFFNNEMYERQSLLNNYMWSYLSAGVLFSMFIPILSIISVCFASFFAEKNLRISKYFDSLENENFDYPSSLEIRDERMENFLIISLSGIMYSIVIIGYLMR